MPPDVNGPMSGTTRVSRYQKGEKQNLDFTEARDSEWQLHQLGHVQVCTSLQTDNHTRTPPLSYFTFWMPFLPPNQLINRCFCYRLWFVFSGRYFCQSRTMQRATLRRLASTFSTFSVERRAPTSTFRMWSTISTTLNETQTMIINRSLDIGQVPLIQTSFGVVVT